MDRRAIQILFNTYWTPQGWKNDKERTTTPADFTYAKNAGVMFDPLRITHDEVLLRLVQARDALDKQRVADAFLVSLSTRRLELRSVLGSYAVFRHVALHPPIRSAKQCRICGQYLASSIEDLNVLNFERFKWGGVRHDSSLYAMLDMELFLREKPVYPTQEDIDIFRMLIATIKMASAKTTAATLQSQLTRVFKSNKSERDNLIAILGFCGILETPEHKSYRLQFVSDVDRDYPSWQFVEMPYPACWWSGQNGLNQNALQEWFGHVLSTH